jgi:uracil-DNA glycosylase
MELLPEELKKPSFTELGLFLGKEYKEGKIWPKPENIFRAYELCDPDDVKVVIVGQDPYPNEHAHGLSFSTTQSRRPVSLHYIFKEICSCYPEYEIERDFLTNNLTSWARQGVFLLNSVLTVREKESNSHKGKGWEEFTQATIKALFDNKIPKVFILWGKEAQATFANAVPKPVTYPHQILFAGHPAAAAYGKDVFSGNRHFYTANEWLKMQNRQPITWKPNVLLS